MDRKRKIAWEIMGTGKRWSLSKFFERIIMVVSAKKVAFATVVRFFNMISLYI